MKHTRAHAQLNLHSQWCAVCEHKQWMLIHIVNTFLNRACIVLKLSTINLRHTRLFFQPSLHSLHLRYLHRLHRYLRHLHAFHTLHALHGGCIHQSANRHGVVAQHDASTRVRVNTRAPTQQFIQPQTGITIDESDVQALFVLRNTFNVSYINSMHGVLVILFCLKMIRFRFGKHIIL